MLPTPLPQTPETVGPYRLTRVLGEGATGVVYLAERTDFAQRVALKLFHPSFVTEHLSSSAEEEARILLLLDHPHIVRTIGEATERSGSRYLVMEYVEGQPIDQFADARRLSISLRIELLLQALDALEHAHRHLVIHRDLKPAHLLITPDAQCKLLDFGTAGALAPAAYTPEYSSPEQKSSLPDASPVSVASDLYSLALIARLLLAGLPPSADPEVPPSTLIERLPDSAGAELAEARAVSLRQLLRSLSGDLDAILLRALSPAPDRRYLSAAQFASDLRAYSQGSPVLARPVSRAERSRRWVLQHRFIAGAAAALVCAILLSAAGVLWQSARAIQERRKTETRLRDLVQLTGTLDGELYSSLGSLPDTASARAMLLTSATSTLDDLANSAGSDPTLSLELSGQYGRLARLELAQQPRARKEAAHDIAQGLELLQNVPTNRSQNLSVERQRTELLALRQSVQP